MGIEKFELSQADKIKYSEVDMKNIFRYLLTKNVC